MTTGRGGFLLLAGRRGSCHMWLQAVQMRWRPAAVGAVLRSPSLPHSGQRGMSGSLASIGSIYAPRATRAGGQSPGRGYRRDAFGHFPVWLQTVRGDVQNWTIGAAETAYPIRRRMAQIFRSCAGRGDDAIVVFS